MMRFSVSGRAEARNVVGSWRSLMNPSGTRTTPPRSAVLSFSRWSRYANSTDTLPAEPVVAEVAPVVPCSISISELKIQLSEKRLPKYMTQRRASYLSPLWSRKTSPRNSP